MIKLKNIRVKIEEVNARLIEWEVTSTNETISDYTVALYRGETPSKVLTELTEVALLNANSGRFLDDELNNMDYSRNRVIFYTLKVYKTSTPETYEIQEPVRSLPIPDNYTLAILSDKNLLFNNPRFNARTFSLRKKRTWGDRCSDCFDPVTQRVTKDKCTTCYGTGFEGGYYSSIIFRAMVTDRQNQKNITEMGIMDDTEVIFFTSNHPEIVPGDVITDEFNNRFYISGPIRHTRKGQYIITQTFRAKQMPKSDVIYSINEEDYFDYLNTQYYENNPTYTEPVGYYDWVEGYLLYINPNT